MSSPNVDPSSVVPLRVHQLGPEPSAAAIEATTAAAGGRIHFSAGAEPPDDAAAVRVVVTGRPSVEALDAMPAIEAVVIPFAGVPGETRQICRDRPGLRLHNLHHNAAVTAEAAITLLLAAARRLVPCDRALRQDDWGPRWDATPALRLAGRPACVLGYGAIGRRVARVLGAMDMEVRAVRRREPERDRDGDVRVFGAAAIEEAVDGASALMICVPHTDATDGLVDGALLDRLDSSAVVVNVGRGPIVVEADLHARVADGRLFGAGLDAWWTYPESPEARGSTAPGSCDWAGLDGAVLSPHRGGHESGEAGDRRRHAALGELLRALADGRTEHQRVDLEAGY